MTGPKSVPVPVPYLTRATNSRPMIWLVSQDASNGDKLVSMFHNKSNSYFFITSQKTKDRAHKPTYNFTR